MRWVVQKRPSTINGKVWPVGSVLGAADIDEGGASKLGKRGLLAAIPDDGDAPAPMAWEDTVRAQDGSNPAEADPETVVAFVREHPLEARRIYLAEQAGEGREDVLKEAERVANDITPDPEGGTGVGMTSNPMPSGSGAPLPPDPRMPSTAAEGYEKTLSEPDAQTITERESAGPGPADAELSGGTEGVAEASDVEEASAEASATAALEESSTVGFDPGKHSNKEVLEHVEANPEDRQAVLDAERAGQNRPRLVRLLEAEVARAAGETPPQS